MFKQTHKSVNPNRKRALDRFIPLRIDLPNVDSAFGQVPDVSSPENSGNAVAVNYAKLRYKQHNYQQALRAVMFPQVGRTLNIFPPKPFVASEFTAQETRAWPVRNPRKEPIINSPLFQLDLPEFGDTTGDGKCDWNRNSEYIASIFHGEAYMWSSQIEGPNSMSTTCTGSRVAFYIKWHPKGRFLAMGLLPNKVGVWDQKHKKVKVEATPCSSHLRCHVTALEWMKNNYLYVGCSQGALIQCHLKSQAMHTITSAHRGEIRKISASAKETYVATVGSDKSVVIWTLPDLKQYCTFDSSGVGAHLAWHPFSEPLLAVGMSNYVALWHVDDRKEINREYLVNADIMVGSIIFNPISAEMVVTYFPRPNVPENAYEGSGFICVMTNFKQFVEAISFHTGYIPSLMWGSGGRVLASAGQDENMALWDFFNDSTNRKSQVEKPKAIIKRSAIFATIR